MPTVMNGVSLNALTTVDTWSALSLFANGEQGTWYDPSDMSTMFQDSAGTTPVTAVEQPVGLILDKSKNLKSVFVGGLPFVSPWLGYNGGTIAGNTVTTSTGDQGARILIVAGSTYRITANVASMSGTFYYVAEGVGTNYGTVVSGQQSFLFRATGSSLLIYGINAGSVIYNSLRIEEIPGNHANQATSASRPVLSARVNALVQTEDFSNASWNLQSNISISSGVSDPDGGSTAFTITANSAVGRLLQYAPNLSYSGISSIWIRRRTGTGAINWEAPAVGVGQSISLTSSWQRVSYTTTPPGGGTWYYGFRIADSGDAIDIWHPDLRVANVGTNLPPYQRVGAAVAGTTNPAVTGVPDYDTNGFPLYLRFDGVDDSLSTSSIDFTATDKMSVFAGHRIVSGTGSQIICELGQNGYATSGFAFAQGPVTATSGLGFLMNAGGAIAGETANKSLPYTSVSSLLLDSSKSGISNEGILRSNTATQTFAITDGNTDSGTANFPNKNLYIGNRSGSSVWFNGHLYNLIIRGALSNSSQIENAENYINSKTKAY